MTLSAHFDGKLTACLDEVGRGCLWGPIVSAAVVMDPTDSYVHPLLKDSKKMTAKNRQIVADWAQQHLKFAIKSIDAATIDRVNVLQANMLAFHGALDGLPVTPEHVLVDGNTFKPYKDIPHTLVVKGDSLYAGIAYASVIAKTYRDAWVKNIVNDNPELDMWYALSSNKGYPSPSHLAGIKSHGVVAEHRKTFGPCKSVNKTHPFEDESD